MEIAIRCTCGTLQGTLRSGSFPSSKRFICYCDDCQTFAHYLGRASDILDRSGGTEVWTVTPAQITISTGQSQISCVRLSPKGLYRWYAGCCRSPIGNASTSTHLPYFGLIHTMIDRKGNGKSLEELLGPVYAGVQGKFGIPPLPQGTAATVTPRVIMSMIGFFFFAFLRGMNRPSPFLDDQGRPIVEPTVLTRQERDRLRKLSGPLAAESRTS